MLRDKFANWLILVVNREAVYECYSIESDSNELDFDLGVAVAVRGAMPKALSAERQRTLFVGFDSASRIKSILHHSQSSPNIALEGQP